MTDPQTRDSKDALLHADSPMFRAPILSAPKADATPTKCEGCPLAPNCDGHAWFDGEFDHICKD